MLTTKDSIISEVSVEQADGKPTHPAWRPRVVWLVALIGAVCALFLQTDKSIAQNSSYSLRFYGHGMDDIDRVKIPIDPLVPADVGATDFTFEWWMKASLGENESPSCTPGEDNWIYGNIVFDRDIYGPGDYGDYGISLTDGRIAFGVHNGTSGETLCGSLLVADGDWHHIAVTRRRTDGLMRIFVDGQLDGEVDGPDGDVSYRDGRGTQYENDPFLVFGAEKHDAGPDYPSYSGWIDEIRLSDVVRYTSGFEPPSGPFTSDGNTVALYHLDEGPVGACTSTVLDGSEASGGPSQGMCSYGGADPAGPVYTTDVPFIQDKTPPAISNIAASPLATEAVITWETDEPATSQVTYGAGATLILSTTESIEYTTSHRIVLANLSPDTAYAYAVRSTDEAGNMGVSAVFDFRTLASENVFHIYLPLVLRSYGITETNVQVFQSLAVGLASAATLVSVVLIAVRLRARIRRSQNANQYDRLFFEPAMRICRGCAMVLTLALGLCGCGFGREPHTNAIPPTPDLEGITRERRQVRFASQGVALAGELDLPLGDVPVPLVFVIHHSGPVDRDSYGYLAEILVKEGYAVFRFDKRGTGMSDGEYGCCEGQDALAAYRAAAAQDGIDRCNVFIVAQSVGTQHLAERFEAYVQARPPRGVVLLSNLLDADEINVIAAPVHIIISDSEPNADQLGRAAAEAHRRRYPFGASYYIAEQTEHTLFDIRNGPIDWNDPEWTQRYHRGAMQSLTDWLNGHLVAPESCP